MKKTFETTIVRDGSMCFIPIPFDPRPVFGKVRAKVKVTVAGHTYRSTIASMGNGPCVPLRRSNREAAGLEGNEKVRVTLTLDEEPRVVSPPADFVRALKAGDAWDRWSELSYSHQREHVDAVDGAKRPETRIRRIDAAVKMLAARPPRRGATNDLSERVRDCLKGRGGVTETRLMGGLAFMIDGSMCCSVSAAGLLVRVRPSARDGALAKAHVTAMKLGARTMKGFVRVGAAAIETNGDLKKWLAVGIASSREK